MTLYVQATTREHELLEAEIKQIIEGFPKVNNDDGMDDEAGFRRIQTIPRTSRETIQFRSTNNRSIF